ncbi:MAG: 23S rRNA (pseudouridine(1915)-N(3))-methyltransferase RlmH [Oligoflexales bacterium]|nr:23S rRNA (pseudouridine(1915)-N(3))-methyltransferase RlmH [Oligoflexales bacterium]
MKLRIVKVGKPREKEYEALVEGFRNRLKAFVKIEELEIKSKEGVEKSEKALFEALGISSNEKKSSSDLLIILDERGELWSSTELASNIRKWGDDPAVKTVTFVVGGPYGLPLRLKEKADRVWGISKAVFPSDMAWLLVWEQIYRAYTLVNGIAYHHE